MTHNPNFVIERPATEPAREPLPLALKLALMLGALIYVASRLVVWLS